jgi:DNA-binding NtrC family response regulator
VLAIHVPPLRERRQDIPLLVSHFLAQTCADLGLPQKDITPEALAWLSVQPWPGNVRELGNYVRRLVVHTGGATIDQEHLHADEHPAAPASGEPGGVKPYLDAKTLILDEFTKSYVGELMRKTRGNISVAARLSGLERWSLQKILKRVGISPADYSED